MQALLETLRKIYPEEQLLLSEPMYRHTTFRVGGPADLMVLPANRRQICATLDAARESGVPLMVMGNGSNLLVRDGGIRGVVMVLGERFSRIEANGTRLTAEAGAMLSRVAARAQEEGLSGLEFASGIPGSLGGGCAMNAGAYGGELKDVLESAEVWMDGEVRVLSQDQMEMGYRSTMPLRRGALVLSAVFALTRGDREQIGEKMRELNGRRRDKQPLNLPSAGSTFKRPEGYFAGRLIEDAGLKGFSIGGAQVSEKHAGFIVNTGDATAADILALIEYVSRTVLRRFGVMLEPEVRIVGED